MNIAVIVPFKGKEKYQNEYSAIVDTVEANGGTVLSPEKAQEYERSLKMDTTLHDTPRSHYEFIRKSIIDSDAVIVEASWEDFRVGHETTLALLYRKPVLALSQTLDLGKYIHHPDFYGIQYQPSELRTLVRKFIKRVERANHLSATSVGNLYRYKKTVAVFGGVYADIWNRVAEIPRANEVTLSETFKVSLGGKATNAAVALARMGNEVFICGRIGRDTMVSDLEAALIHESIKTDFLYQDRKADTGTVTLAVNQRAKYSTVVYEAANVRITKESVDRVFQAVDSGRLKLDAVYLTLEPQKDMVAYIVHEADKRALFILCDAAPHTRPLDIGLLPYIDIVAPNQLEAQAITGIQVIDSADAETAARYLMDNGARRVVITLGDKGAYYVDRKGATFAPPFMVRAIDEAAAGDAFRAVLLHAYMQNKPLDTALNYASAAGAYAVTCFGSYASMPNQAQLDGFLKDRSPLIHMQPKSNA